MISSRHSRHSLRAFSLGLLLSCPAAVLAGDLLQAEAGFSSMVFDYAEYADSGQLLDRERADLPGLSVKLSRVLAPWQVTAEFAHAHGDAAYSGQTSAGAALATTTTESIADGSLRLARWFQGETVGPYAVYGGLGYRHWQRDILATPSASGVDEAYCWPYALLGLEKPLHDHGRNAVTLDMRLMQPLRPTIAVDFHGLYDDAHLDLGARPGVRFGVTWRHALSATTALTVEPYLEQWRLGRSAMVGLTRNGGATGTVYEPRSETGIVGVNLRLRRNF